MLTLSPETPVAMLPASTKLDHHALSLLAELKVPASGIASIDGFEPYTRKYACDEVDESTLTIMPFDEERYAELMDWLPSFSGDPGMCLEMVKEDPKTEEPISIVGFVTQTVVYGIGKTIDKLAEIDPLLPGAILRRITPLYCLGISNPLEVYEHGDMLFMSFSEDFEDGEPTLEHRVYEELHPNLKLYLEAAQSEVVIPEPFKTLLLHAEILQRELRSLDFFEDSNITGFYNGYRCILTGDHETEDAMRSVHRQLVDDEAEMAAQMGADTSLRYLTLVPTRKLTTFLRVWSRLQAIFDELVSTLSVED
jgi:hypothetical protein